MTRDTNNDRKNISKHILPAASNLLGLCFVILTLKKIWKANTVGRFIDKLDGVTILIFLTASLLSYASMRAARRGELYEKIADIVFLSGLVLLALIAVVTAFELA
jgi:type III secretory pathway component EscT